jgi:hypothetical protein
MIKTLDEAPAEIRRLGVEGRAQGVNWTVAQIAEHLARTIDWSLRRMPNDEPSPIQLAPLKRFLARQMVLLQGRIPPNVPTLRALVPAPDTKLHSALDHLRESIAALHAARGPLPDHPFLGPMSKRAWIRFHLVHARHHLVRIESH